MFRSSSLRLVFFYTLGFALAVLVLGIVTLISTHAALDAQFNERILSDSSSLVDEFRTEGIRAVTASVSERDAAPGALDFGLQDPAGRPIAGNLGAVHTTLGWSTVNTSEPSEGEQGPSRIYTVKLTNGYRILVGDDESRIYFVEGVVVRNFALAFFGMLMLGGVGGYALSRSVNRRIGSITATAEAIIDGDLGSRVPARGDHDELDRLATTLNRMLDRIAGLMESLRQVSTDVAHDLRTPLTRLRQQLEAQINKSPNGERDRAIEAAIIELDGILGTFAALLRISQIESGARRAGFRRVDLISLAGTVVDAFRPSAEENRQTLELVTGAPVVVDGDAELLTQMIANLVENALRHAGREANIRVVARTVGTSRDLSVFDDGPGVPPSEREKLFNRFHRLESSRSTPGNGLGLALVAAVAKLHGAEASLHDAAPGLEARIVFAGTGG